MMNKTLRIAAIPGDGIGKEVLPEGVRVLQAAAERWGLALSFEHFGGPAATITRSTAP
jgi:tartrate dehydrogenase/decarboxylase/D-malate dehydrogenase